MDADVDDLPPNLLCKSDTNLSSIPKRVPPIPPKNMKFNDEWAPLDHRSHSGHPDHKAPNDVSNQLVELQEDKLPPLPPKAK